MNKVAAILVTLLASDDQHVLLRGNVDLVIAETGDGEVDAVIVLAKLDEIERGVIILARAGVVLHHVEQPVEADGGTPIGREIESTTHVMSSN